MLTQVFRAIELGDFHSWEILSDRVSFIRQGLKRPGKNGRTSKIKVLYVACSSYSEAVRVRNGLTKRLDSFRAFIREAEAVRSLDWEYEVKIQGDFSLDELGAIAREVDTLYPVAQSAPSSDCLNRLIEIGKSYDAQSVPRLLRSSLNFPAPPVSAPVQKKAAVNQPIDRPKPLTSEPSFWKGRLPSWNPSLTLGLRRSIASYA